MLSNATGVTITTMKLKIQLALVGDSLDHTPELPVDCNGPYLVASAFVGARIRSGTISAGYSHVIPSQPMAKNVLKTKRKTAWPTPAPLSL